MQGRTWERLWWNVIAGTSRVVTCECGKLGDVVGLQIEGTGRGIELSLLVGALS